MTWKTRAHLLLPIVYKKMFQSHNMLSQHPLQTVVFNDLSHKVSGSATTLLIHSLIEYIPAASVNIQRENICTKKHLAMPICISLWSQKAIGDRFSTEKKQLLQNLDSLVVKKSMQKDWICLVEQSIVMF